MHRSSSGSRVSDGFVVTSSSSSTSQSSSFGANPDNTEEHLPTYNPLSQAAKRERSRIRSAENAIHFIPLVLVLCAIILWFFSNPDSQWQHCIDLGFGRIKLLRNDDNTGSDNTKSSLPPNIKLRGL
ncbi:hypothetical protein FNV43_RR08978 [Rhamnella rubrinervis]|uniref:Transmembrane protein n=1 Tax=Rhamnella rubrinervis TaxID=2594499 RepID=A0A8K0MJW3_9ROSA|nr:hypothetical protein FNV43_RR08978 [Rhamnella rubrinervis]